MTTISGDADGGRLCCCHNAAGGCPTASEPPDLSELFHRFRRRVDGIRATGGDAAAHPSGPADLALAVVTEALAIGEAMSRLAMDLPGDEAESNRSPAVYAEIDSRFVEHRARALRSALHGVDDYVWWGSLATAPG